MLAAFAFELGAVVGDVGSAEGSSNLKDGAKGPILTVYIETTYRRSQVSSNATPTGRFPLVYSLQYPPTSNILESNFMISGRCTMENDALRDRQK